jgi:hypothetical protein
MQASKNLNISPEIIAEKMDRWRQNHEYTLNRLNSILMDSRKQHPQQSGLWGNNDMDLLNVI